MQTEAKRLEKNRRQRERRRKTGNVDTLRYEKTPSGFIMRVYNNLVGRCLGRVKPHLYAGLPYLDRATFYAWARDSKEFWRLYRRWVMAGYDQRLTPSLNRINPTQGYMLDNIEWLTHSANSSLGALNRTKVSDEALNCTLRRVAQLVSA